MTLRGSTDTRIWNAALALFARQGFVGTSTRDIAEAVNLTPGALYHYMGSKDNLLEQVMFGAMTGLLTASEAIVESTTDPVLRVSSFVRLHVAVHAKHRFEARVVDREIEQLGAANRKRITAMRDQYETRWRTEIAGGNETGAFHVPDPRLATLALLGMCTEVATWYRPQGQMSPDVVGLRFLDLSLALLRATDGSGRTLTSDAVELPDAAPFLAIYEERGGHGIVGAKATSRSGS